MRMHDFGMKLQSKKPAFAIRHSSYTGDFSSRGYLEPGRGGSNGIGVAHPDLRMTDTVPERVRTGDCEMRDAVLAALAFLHFAAEVMRQKLMAVTDS